MSTDIRGLAASQLFPIEMDAAGWGQFVSFGHTIGDSTQLRLVARAPRAAILWFDARCGHLESRSTWQWPERPRIETMNKAPIGDLVDALRRDVKAYESVASRSTVLLSGGFDSRLIACLVRESGVEAEGLIVRHKDEYDAYVGQTQVIRSVAPHAHDFTQARASRHRALSAVERARNRNKSKVRAKGEQAFLVIKRLIGFATVCYRGIAKKANRLFVAGALANLFMVRRTLLRAQHRYV